jgi:hypothetical protein
MLRRLPAKTRVVVSHEAGQPHAFAAEIVEMPAIWLPIPDWRYNPEWQPLPP